MGTTKWRKTKENDNYGIYFYLIASKMGFTCSNTTPRMCWCWCCLMRATCVQHSVEAKWHRRRENKKISENTSHRFIHDVSLLSHTHALAPGLLATEMGPKHHQFWTHCILNTNRRPMSGPYKFALTKMDSKLGVCLCVIVFVHQFVVECLWHQNQTQRREEKQWRAFVCAARGKTFDFSPDFRSMDSTHCRLLVTLLFTICCH